MTAALDADFGPAFLSNTTVQSLRDLGFIVVDFYGPGDLDSDADMDSDDIDLLIDGVNALSTDSRFDLDWSESVNRADVDAWLNAMGTVVGDVNLDQRVNAADLNIIAGNWRSQGVKGWSDGDLNGDGFVGSADLNQLALAWRFGDGKQVSFSSVVPEPETWYPILLSLAGLCRYRHRCRTTRHAC